MALTEPARRPYLECYVDYQIRTKDVLLSMDNLGWTHAKKINLKPQHRDIGIVFQDYALFPNLTVKENLRYALKQDQPDTIVNELLEMMELTNLHDKKPELLSGGQRQRVALARAIVKKTTDTFAR